VEILIHLLGPLHPPIVHFAVACPLLALFALGAQKVFQKQWLGLTAAALWGFAFLAALAAGATGHLFSLSLGMESEFSIIPSGSIAQGRLQEHVLLGSASLLFSLLTLWAAVRTFQERPLPWKVQILVALISAALVGLTGHEGGEMVYGSEPASAPVSAVSPPEESTGKKIEKTNPAPSAEVPPPSPSGDLLSQTQNYRTHLVKMNSRPWNSRTHGHRWVNTYVSKEAVEAYEKSDPLPEGTQVVKESFENAGGKASGQSGPLYVMVKNSSAATRSTGGWQYALVWEKPVPHNPENIQEAVRWLPGDPHLNSCVKCHNHFKLGDYMGGIPEGFEKNK